LIYFKKSSKTEGIKDVSPNWKNELVLLNLLLNH